MAELSLSPHDVVAAGLCIGCGACARGKDGLEWDRYGELKPIGAWTRQPSEAFARTCPFSPAAMNEDAIAAGHFPTAPFVDPLIGRYEQAYVGHVVEQPFRAEGSSGGMVSWTAAELMRRGLIDGIAHVAPAEPDRDGRFFHYRLSRSEEEIVSGAKSRYYPIELSQVLTEIREVPGRYAIVGVPCFIKAVHLLRRQEPMLAERIAFTLGLFCGHMKSARFVESLAWQLGAPISDVRRVDYRRKDPNRPANWYTAHLTLADGSARWQDWWHLVDGDWGAGFFQNSACNFCDDVVAETADISFGDAWVEPYSSDGRGTNVVVVRSPLLRDIVEEAIAQQRLALSPVDAAFVVETQAAGLRQRREGLSYRLAFMPPALPLRKRVPALRRSLPLKRKLIYRTRAAISRWSHRVFAMARRLKLPVVYLMWARTVLRFYQALAHGRGSLGRLLSLLDRSSSR